MFTASLVYQLAWTLFSFFHLSPGCQTVFVQIICRTGALHSFVTSMSHLRRSFENWFLLCCKFRSDITHESSCLRQGCMCEAVQSRDVCGDVFIAANKCAIPLSVPECWGCLVSSASTVSGSSRALHSLVPGGTVDPNTCGLDPPVPWAVRDSAPFGKQGVLVAGLVLGIARAPAGSSNAPKLDSRLFLS